MLGRATIRLGIGPHSSVVDGLVLMASATTQLVIAFSNCACSHNVAHVVSELHSARRQLRFGHQQTCIYVVSCCSRYCCSDILLHCKKLNFIHNVTATDKTRAQLSQRKPTVAFVCYWQTDDIHTFIQAA